MEQMKLKDRLSAKVQTLQTTPALPSSDYLALNGSTLDLIHENLKDQPLTYQMFDIVKSPSGGSTVFTVPGLAGEEAEKELTGIILDYTLPRAYWSTPDPVEGDAAHLPQPQQPGVRKRQAMRPLPFQRLWFQGRRDRGQGLQGVGAAVPAAAGQRPAPIGAGAGDQQGTVSQIHRPPHQHPDSSERGGHPDLPQEGHQPGRKTLCPFPL